MRVLHAEKEKRERRGSKRKEKRKIEKKNKKEKDKEKEGRLCNRADSKHRYSWAIKSSEKERVLEREYVLVRICWRSKFHAMVS